MHQRQFISVPRHQSVLVQEFFGQPNSFVLAGQLRSVVAQVLSHAAVKSEVSGVQVVLEGFGHVVLRDVIDGVVVRFVKTAEIAASADKPIH